MRDKSIHKSISHFNCKIETALYIDTVEIGFKMYITYNHVDNRIQNGFDSLYEDGDSHE